MSIFIKCINIYKKYNFEVRTGLNPYHFKFKEPLGLPFTAFRKENDLSIISTGGGFHL